jgi:hypothetical protein
MYCVPSVLSQGLAVSHLECTSALAVATAMHVTNVQKLNYTKQLSPGDQNTHLLL